MISKFDKSRSSSERPHQETGGAFYIVGLKILLVPRRFLGALPLNIVEVLTSSQGTNSGITAETVGPGGFWSSPTAIERLTQL
jgi:hypothetical protein